VNLLEKHAEYIYAYQLNDFESNSASTSWIFKFFSIVLL